MTAEALLTKAFEEDRARLTAVAFRALGSWADAEDAVQEAWLRLSRQDSASIVNLSGWLTTVVGRICIDVLRSRTVRTEVPYDQSLELVVTGDDQSPAATPEENAVVADSVGLALLVVLESLRPDERLALVLHDMFKVPFAQVGEVIGKSADASKMLASRARRKVREVSSCSDSLQGRHDVVDAFLAAARDGDFEGLLRVLDPNVTWRKFSPRGATVSSGPSEVVQAVKRGARSRGVAGRVRVNGEPGIMFWSPQGRPVSVMACTVVGDRMVALVSVVDPKQLANLNLPAPPPRL